jgi:hypothetical protein
MINPHKELAEKLNSKKYRLSEIMKATDISRYWLNEIRSEKVRANIPEYFIVTLNDYFRKLSD